MKYKDITKNRTKKVLFIDKLENPANFMQTLKLEVYSSFREFMDLKAEDIVMNVSIDECGEYKIEIVVKTKNIKPVGVVLK
ncbi:MAG: hypothetical protein IJ542_02365 [Clostridia bacterium]|nr:hypothetical protein [Clostridia bacterium]